MINCVIYSIINLMIDLSTAFALADENSPSGSTKQNKTLHILPAASIQNIASMNPCSNEGKKMKKMKKKKMDHVLTPRSLAPEMKMTESWEMVLALL
jgi:hypothetical protein